MEVRWAFLIKYHIHNKGVSMSMDMTKINQTAQCFSYKCISSTHQSLFGKNQLNVSTQIDDGVGVYTSCITK